MSNAALLLHPDAIATDGPTLVGRQSAGESFLRGFIRHADVDQFYFWHHWDAAQGSLTAAVKAIEPTDKPHRWIRPADRSLLSRPGVVHLPGPNIDMEAWARRPYGDHAYSLCGVTHTTATARTMDSIANLLVAPLQDHDALICTSSAVRASVEAHLDGVREHLVGQYGPRRRPEAQRVTIPLGVDTAAFVTTGEDRQRWRQRLDIPADAFVVLYVGRFHAAEKMNPALMALALERAAQRLGQTIYWVNSGWAAAEQGVADVHEATRALCPSVQYRVVDGRPAEVRFSIWSVADAFISFSDNIQETFGLTPVEAMAAGLPCIVTDWNGYRDTVRHGEDGFRIDTVTPPPGGGFDFAYWHANGWYPYVSYVAAASQVTAVDLGQATDAICALAENPALRREMGGKAQARARSVFDWSAIVPQYQALWAQQNARRLAAPPSPRVADNPYRPDPFRLFAAYPTRQAGPGWRARVVDGMDWAAAQALLSSPLAALGALNRPTFADIEQILVWLTPRPDARVEEINELFPPLRRAMIERGLLWLARFGVIELRPPA